MQVFLTNISLIAIIFLSGYFLFYIPGKVINSAFLKNKSDFIISISIGFSIFTLISFFVYELNLKVSTTVIFYLLFNTLFLFFLHKIYHQDKSIIRYLNFDNRIYVVSIFGLLTLLFFIYPIHLRKDGSDMWYYLAIVRSFIDHGYFSNISPWFDDVQSSYPSNSFFLYLTIINYLAPNASLLDIFRVVGVFLTTLSIFINTLILNLFIKNLKYSFSIILLIFATSFIFGDNLIFLMTNYPYYPKIFSSTIFIPILIYIFFTKIYEKKFFFIFLTLIFISFINQSSINLTILALMVIVFLIIEPKLIIIKKKAVYLFIPLFFSTLLFYLYLADFYFSQSGVLSNYTNDLSINASANGPYYGEIIEIFKNFFIYNPEKYFSNLTHFYLLLFFLSIFIKNILKNKLLTYYYIMLLSSFLIVFNPISIFILNKLMPINFLIRLNWIFVGYIFLGFLIGNIISNFKLKKNIYKFLLISTTLYLFILIGDFYKKNDFVYLNSFRELEKNLKNIEVDSFVITDKYTSNKLLAFKRAKFLISHENWLKFTTPDQNFKRYFKIYDNDDSFLDKNTFEYLNSIKADYLLIDKQKTKNYAMIRNIKNLKIIFDDNYFLLIEI
jgi:hypothetical protein